MNNKGADQSAQAGLCLCYSQTLEDRFSLVETHLLLSSEGSGESVHMRRLAQAFVAC